MPSDRAQETLRRARKLRLSPTPRTLRDFIGQGDSTDLYRFKSRATSQIDLTLSKLRANANVEIYQVKGKLRNVLRKIGRIDFDDLSRRDIRRNLRRIGRSTRKGKRNETLSLDVGPGTFFVRVYPNRNRDSTRYRLRISATPEALPVLDSVGNTLADATQIPSESTVNIFADQIGVSDPSDVYRFDLGDRKKVFLALTNLQANADLNLLDSTGALIKNSAKIGVESEAIVRNLKAGTYYIQVVPQAGSTTPYTLTSSIADLTTTTLYNGVNLPADTVPQSLALGQFPIPETLAPIPINLLPPNIRDFFGDPIPETYVPGIGVNINSQFSTTNPNQGYVGYSNYQPDLSSINTVELLGANSLDDLDVDFNLVNSLFPVLDASVGYTLEFTLTLNSETSGANRAGFSLIMMNNTAQGVELAFKGDRIFAQSANFTEVATESAPLSSIGRAINYTLDVSDTNYELFADGTSLFSGLLRDFNFDPALSDPPLPFSPYDRLNFLFFGDNTDQGHADFTLGPISLFT
ncbi:MAG: PPC domain-containing protein [Elainellaceae cyanobacterium]